MSPPPVLMPLLLLSSALLAGASRQHKLGWEHALAGEAGARLEALVLRHHRAPAAPTSPNATGHVPAVPVAVSVDIRAVSDPSGGEPSAFHQELRVHLDLRLEWQDKRLAYKNVSGLGRSPYLVVLPDAHLFWTPDVVFVNEKELVPEPSPKAVGVLRVGPHGRVQFRARYSVVLFCPMDLARFPFDRQVCPLLISTYTSTAAEVQLQWRGVEPVRLARPAYLPTQFAVTKVDHADGCADAATTTASCIEASLSLSRPCAHYVLTIYTPCVLMVILAWLSFWLDRYLRFATAMVAVTSLAAHVALVNASLPAVPYTKAVDVWTGGCLWFAFCALVQFVVLECTCQCGYRPARGRRRGEGRGWKVVWSLANEVPSDQSTAFYESLQHEASRDRIAVLECSPPSSSCSPWFCLTWSDRVARLAYPVLFAAFAAAYWLSYAVA